MNVSFKMKWEGRNNDELVLAEYHFLQRHCYFIFHVQVYVLMKWCNNVLARTGTQQELVAPQ